jgi:hypothetical protein
MGLVLQVYPDAVSVQQRLCERAGGEEQLKTLDWDTLRVSQYISLSCSLRPLAPFHMSSRTRDGATDPNQRKQLHTGY